MIFQGMSIYIIVFHENASPFNVNKRIKNTCTESHREFNFFTNLVRGIRNF